MKKKKNFIFKIVFSYLLLAALTLWAGWFFYLELDNILPKKEELSPKESQLLLINKLTNSIYEAESLSKLALQNNNSSQFVKYAVKVDSILLAIGGLKNQMENAKRTTILDSLSGLLKQKVLNNKQLRKLDKENIATQSIDSLLQKIKTVEANVGTITPRALVPNFDQLPKKTQQSVIDYAEILNKNAKREQTVEQERKLIDSVLIATQNLLLQTKIKQQNQNRQIASKELQILRMDLEISQKLTNLTSTLEQEVLLQATQANVNQSLALKKSTNNIKWLGLIAIVIIILSIYFISRDFRKVQRLSWQLDQANTYTKQLLQAREQLIKTVSHDMRSPLGLIKGYAELLPEANNATESQKYINNIQLAASQVNQLANDLLDFSKLEAGKLQLNPTQFVPAQLITSTAQSLRPTNSTIALIIDLAPELNNTFKTDPFRYRQVLNNLISNAFKFTKEGHVKVSGRLEDNFIVVNIADTGTGIPNNLQDTIFNEFTQAESTAKSQGYGLGLTIAKKITELLNGSINFTSVENIGTTFVVKIPMETVNTLNLPTTLPTTKKAKVIIIDDDPNLLELTTTFFKQLQIDFLAYIDFEEVPDIANLEYDLVITDMQMPNYTGFEVLDRFKNTFKHYKGQPIIAMTGNMELTKGDCTQAGFTDLIHKPFSKELLVQMLKTYLGYETVIENTNQETVPEFETFNPEKLVGFLDPKEVNIKLKENLLTFYEETLKNRSIINKAIEKRDSVTIRETAHRMLPMFRLLEIKDVIPFLEELESNGNTIYQNELNYKLQQTLDEIKDYLQV
ncbi:hybrid sensor histidine kinase/response regulator [Croceivirga radicis]|uniref:hybrid sensor histidine kinase/response regulator n=1 Tax=Croceivirga radicis TaxID=1929488 RepID=UPI000255AE0A|nr:hybrid sensor histidine kinase/response regulator [Croceivirga radicis]